jgi:hypothetical protein
MEGGASLCAAWVRIDSRLHFTQCREVAMTEMCNHTGSRDPDTIDLEEMIAAKAGGSDDGKGRAALVQHVAMVHKLAEPRPGAMAEIG